MIDRVVIDEFHLTVTVAQGLGPADATAVRRALDRPALRKALLRSVRRVLRRHAALRPVIVGLSR